MIASFNWSGKVPCFNDLFKRGVIILETNFGLPLKICDVRQSNPVDFLLRNSDIDFSTSHSAKVISCNCGFVESDFFHLLKDFLHLLKMTCLQCYETV